MILLVATVDVVRLPWLPQFVSHYQSLGVDRVLISLHLDPDRTCLERRDLCQEAERLLRSVNAELFAVLCCRFRPVRITDHHNQIQRSVCREGDWVVWADIDEFQEYPDPLPEVVRICEELRFQEVRGKFIDRVAVDGSLAPFDPQRSIWEQYPIGAPVTCRITGGLIQKVVASEAGFDISQGHHDLLNHQTRPFPKEVTIHHFKWDASVRERMMQRLTDEYRRHCVDWAENQRFLNYFREHGRIDLSRLPHVWLGTPRLPQKQDPFTRLQD